MRGGSRARRDRSGGSGAATPPAPRRPPRSPTPASGRPPPAGASGWPRTGPPESRVRSSSHSFVAFRHREDERNPTDVTRRPTPYGTQVVDPYSRLGGDLHAPARHHGRQRRAAVDTRGPRGELHRPPVGDRRLRPDTRGARADRRLAG